jgi:hypothetical protein
MHNLALDPESTMMPSIRSSQRLGFSDSRGSLLMENDAKDVTGYLYGGISEIRLAVESFYPNSQLYKDKEELEALQRGAVQRVDQGHVAGAGCRMKWQGGSARTCWLRFAKKWRAFRRSDIGNPPQIPRRRGGLKQL